MSKLRERNILLRMYVISIVFLFIPSYLVFEVFPWAEGTTNPAWAFFCVMGTLVGFAVSLFAGFVFIETLSAHIRNEPVSQKVHGTIFDFEYIRLLVVRMLDYDPEYFSDGTHVFNYTNGKRGVVERRITDNDLVRYEHGNGCDTLSEVKLNIFKLSED